MTHHVDTSERGLQRFIVKYLTSKNGFAELAPQDFDLEFCLYPEELMTFIKETQPDTHAMILRKGKRGFLVRLDKKIKEKGIIELLRKGIKYFDKHVYVFFPQPNSNYNQKDLKKFQQNRFAVTQELVYTTRVKNRLDLTLFVNGLPILTVELKNPFTYQAVFNAIKQYQYDRSPKDKIFHLGRCMAHFAVDTKLVYMAGSLHGKRTTFFPFNKGLNDGKPHGPFGAGNPLNPAGLKTAYLWEEVFTKSSLANLISTFATLVEEKHPETGRKKRTQYFPRYHQMKVVRLLLAHAREHGPGHRYLIQHSAGSGKSNSITWLAHQLVSLYNKAGDVPLFDSVLVVTDRRILDEQIRKNIKAFAQVKRLVEAITGQAKDIKALDPQADSFSKTTHMSLALTNNKKIVICTVQTFPFVLDAIQKMTTKKVAIIIDEAHSSQSGKASAKMNALFASRQLGDLPKDEDGNISSEDLVNYLIDSRKMLPNASYFAFTATPKNKTLETFGIPEPYLTEKGEQKKRYYPFHTYSMKQAIEEEFILDVLQNYTPYKSFYKVKAHKGSETKEYDTKEGNKKIRAYVEGHEIAINEKARIMIDHFRDHVRHRIDNQARAMVVCKSIEAAMKYKEAFDRYLTETNLPFKAIVAFSGKKKHFQTGIELTEEKMNDFPDGDNDIPKQFKHDPYRFLIVANKYQTGFDEPLLHTMYVDKLLANVQAVQTLSRLNRAKKPHKEDTFVLDFFNEAKDIEESFKPYYTTTILSQETDINKLHDLQDALDEVQIYEEEQIEAFFSIYYSDADRDQLDPIPEQVVANFMEELTKDQKIAFKSNAKTFVRTYDYLSKISDLSNPGWEKLWLFLKHLIPQLKIEADASDENILEAINMDSYRTQRRRMRDIELENKVGEVDPIPIGEGGATKTPEYDTLENIVNAFNERFGNIDWGEGVDAKEAEAILVQKIPTSLKEDETALLSIVHSDQANAREESNSLVKNLMQNLMFTNTAIYKKYANDPDFRSRYQEFIFDLLWTQAQDMKREAK